MALVGTSALGPGLWICLVPIMLALILGVRRIAVKRHLLLGRDSMVLPKGLFQMRVAEIEYSSILRVWRYYLPNGSSAPSGHNKSNFRHCLGAPTRQRQLSCLESFLIMRAQENAAQKTPMNPS